MAHPETLGEGEPRALLRHVRRGWSRWRKWPRDWPRPWWPLARITIALLSAGCVLGTLLALAGAHWWVLDLLAGFQVQYAIVLLPAALFYAGRERWLPLLPITTALLVNGAHIAPLYLSKPAPAALRAPRLEVMLIHVPSQARAHDSGRQRAELIARLQSIAAQPPLDVPDVIVLLEVTEPWLTPLTEALPGYRLTGVARDDGFGLAVLAREPVVQSAAVQLVEAPIPAIELMLERGGERFAVLATQAPPPRNQEMAHLRDRMIGLVGRWVAAHSAHAVVIGNLNATLWSHALQKLRDGCYLVSSQVGFGVQATWPAEHWIMDTLSMGLPIDQVLHGSSLTTLARRVGPSLGSNHRTVRVTLAPRAHSRLP